MVGEDVLQFLRRSAFRRKPGVDMLWSQIDDAAMVAGGGDIGRRLVGDGSKRFVPTSHATVDIEGCITA